MVDASAALADKVEKEIFVGLGTGTLMAGFDVSIGDNANTQYSGMAQTALGDAKFVAHNIERRVF